MAWSPERVADYLSEWGLTVVVKGGATFFKPPPGMPKEQAEYIAQTAKAHLSEPGAREAFLALFTPGESVARYDSLTPAGKRRQDFIRCRARVHELRDSFGWSARIAWYSSYDLSTGYLTDQHKAFPLHATAAEVIVDVPTWAESPSGIVDRMGRVLIDGRDHSGRWCAFDRKAWRPLPDSRPPAKWREYTGFRPPPEWHPPPGWWDREAKRQAAAAKARQREYWRSRMGGATFQESLPPD